MLWTHAFIKANEMACIERLGQNFSVSAQTKKA
jgi:hypothetical protein